MKHFKLSLRLAIVGMVILLMCWFKPEEIAKSLEKGVGDGNVID